MIFTVTVAGVAQELQAGSLDVNTTANGRATASFQILSEDRAYRPALDAEVVMEEDGVRIFGGLVDRPSERGFNQGSHPGIVTTVSAVDFNAYAERRVVSATIPAGTLKAALLVLEPYLTVYGVALHASQVDGPSLPALTYATKRLDEILNELATLTADAGTPYGWRISHTKVLRMYQPVTAPALFDLIGNDLPEVIGDLEVETSRGDGYANKVIVTTTPKTAIERIESFAGDGTAGPFPLIYTVTRHFGHVLVLSGGGETMATAPADPGVQWEYDPVTNSLTRLAGATVIGETYSLVFDGVFSGTWTAMDAAAYAISPWERVALVESIESNAAGQAFADALLAKSLSYTQIVKYRTWEQGIEPGQSQLVNVSARNVNETAVITEVVIRDLVHRLDRTVTAVVDSAQTNLGRGWRDVYKAWSGESTSGGGAVSVGSGGAATAGPAPPFTSVQFNNTGAFGGDAAFLYNAETNSLVCGGGSSITAAAHESCQVFGDNCHITD